MTAPLWVGNLVQDFVTNTGLSEITTAGHFDSSWVPCAVHTTLGLAMFNPPLAAGQDSIWCHAMIYNNSADFNEGTSTFQWLNSAGTPILRLYSSTNNGTYVVQWWNGSAWTTLVNPAIPGGLSGLAQHDFRIVINTVSGIFQWYLNKTLVCDISFDASTISGIKQWGILPVRDTCDVSEAMIHTLSTINRRYNLRLPSGAGANSDFTGAYTDVNEAITNNATFLNSLTAGNVSTFVTAGKDLTGYGIDAVVPIHVTARDDTAGAPVHARWALRVGGTNYFAGADSSPGYGFGGFNEIVANDPSTSAAWTPAAAGSAALEVGVKALA